MKVSRQLCVIVFKEARLPFSKSTVKERKKQKMTVTVGEVYRYIDKTAPFSTQDKFDNSGLLTGSMEATVSKIAVCLDITRKAAEEAAQRGAELIVSHHPLIFHKLSAIEVHNPLNILIKNDISAICAHTNIDIAKGGISDMMLELLDFKGETKVLEAIHKDGSGYGRIVELDFAADAPALASACKAAFQCNTVRYYDSGRVIKTVGVCSGAGGSEDNVANAAQKGCDALITGDVKHSGFIEAMNRGITLIDAGHFHTENIICGKLSAELESALGIEAFVCENSRDILRYC